MGSVGANKGMNPQEAYLQYSRQFGPDNMPNEEQSAEMSRLGRLAREWREQNTKNTNENEGIASIESAKKRGAFKSRRRF